MADIIQIRRDTATNWSTVNPILRAGEEGYETDTKKRKVGDGITAWNSLNYDAVFNETLTSLRISGNTLSYTDEAGDTTDISIPVTTPGPETNTTLSLTGNTLSYTSEDGSITTIDLSKYLDNTNTSRIVSGSVNNSTGVVTFTRDDASTFNVDMSVFLGGSGTGNVWNYVTKSSNYTASAFDFIKADSSAGSFSISLPTSPSENDRVIVMDVSSSFSTNIVTIVGNVMGDVNGIDLDIDNSTTEFIYINNTWRVI